jgi:hypothetical protein
MCPGEVSTNITEGIRTKGTPKDLARVDALRRRLDTAIDPGDVGRMVVQAMRDRRFWVLPNGSAYLDAVRAETDELFASGD